nr:MAG TPA: hypothetical protein [Caudoviricetes sp.]
MMKNKTICCNFYYIVCSASSIIIGTICRI